MDTIKTPQAILGKLATRGDLRKLMKSAQQESERDCEIPADSPIWEAWLRLSEYYGAAWTFGAEPTATWVYNLRELTGDELGNGIRNLSHHPGSFPPNPGQFVDLCKTNFDWERQCHKILRTDNMIEDLTTKEARRKERIEEMKKLKASSGLWKGI